MPSQSFKHMVDTFTPTTQAGPLLQETERRSLLRVELPFPAIVRGLDVNQQSFEEHTVLDNLSAHSLALRLERLVEPGAKLFLVVRLATEPAGPAPRVAVRAVVHRVDRRGFDQYSVAMIFTAYRFLYANTR
ncbi:MAG TPA: hypothetical protein VFZ66_20500 [Herpetosiphonaceae bacterium]